MKAAIAIAAVLPAVVLAQSGQRPQFRSGIQLITLEATVRDASGAPVTDLTPSDFSVLVDGKPRKVVFAQFFHSPPPAVVVSDDSTLGRFATNGASPAGHVVVFALDRFALPPGTERPTLESAAAMLDGLSPADSVGLIDIPGTGVNITRDHAQVARALRSIVGMPKPGTSRRSVTWDEAKAIDRGDAQTLGRVIERECLSGNDSFCQQEVHTAVTETLAFGREHAQMLLAALTSLINQLAPIRAPKHVVLLSLGLPFDTEFLDRFKAFERAAAGARVTVDTIRMHAFRGDAASDAKGGIAPEDPSEGTGLDTLASLTGGRAFLGSGRGTGIFTRVLSDITTFYQLGVESDPADANDKLHDIKVLVNRPGASAAARPSVVVSPVNRANLLADALKQPTDLPDVPISVSTYSTFTASGTPQTVIAAEIGAPGSPAPAEWGATALRDGAAVAAAHGAIPTEPERPRIVMATMQLPAGDYRVRVGAVDAAGAIGTLEAPLTSGAYHVGPNAALSDLMVGVRRGLELEPRTHVAASDEVTALVQVSVPDATAVSGTLDFVRGGTATPTVSVPLKQASTNGKGPLSLQVTIRSQVLPPGPYTAIATIRSGHDVLGRVSRVVEIVPGPSKVEPPRDAASVPVGPQASSRPRTDG